MRWIHTGHPVTGVTHTSTHPGSPSSASKVSRKIRTKRTEEAKRQVQLYCYWSAGTLPSPPLWALWDGAWLGQGSSAGACPCIDPCLACSASGPVPRVPTPFWPHAKSPPLGLFWWPDVPRTPVNPGCPPTCTSLTQKTDDVT